jgi:hypothetical protein
VKTIEAATIRRVLKVEKKRLRERRQADFDDNRARSSAASEDALSRVLMLEELLDGGDAIALADEEAGAPGGNKSLDL